MTGGFRNHMKKISITTLIIAFLCVIILVTSGITIYRCLSVDDSMLGKEEDKLAKQANDSAIDSSLLVRAGDWHQAVVQKLLTEGDFRHIKVVTQTVPIAAELARQFLDASDKEGDKYVGDYVLCDEGIGLNVLLWNEAVKLIFTASPSDDEYAELNSGEVKLDIQPIALDGLVFITHKDNPVDSLSIDQIRDIYSGKITNWKEVGGKDEMIRAFGRTKDSYTEKAMKDFVMKDVPMTDTVITFVAEGKGSQAVKAAEYENETASIGFTFRYYINNLYNNPDIKIIRIDGVAPDEEGIAGGKYPFVVSYSMAIKGDETEDSIYRKLYDYLLTDEGKEIIRLAGYCPVKE